MTDRELLEQAAKAAGYGEVWYLKGSDTPYVGEKYKAFGDIKYQVFNPLTDDGDALRLAVKLRLDVSVDFGNTTVESALMTVLELHNNGPMRATRRAIVRAAAEIGKSL